MIRLRQLAPEVRDRFALGALKHVAHGQSSDEAELEILRGRFNALSERQHQVMELAVSGLSSKEIGAKLKISAKTVENHRAWVMERVGARNLAELVRMAMQIQPRP